MKPADKNSPLIFKYTAQSAEATLKAFGVSISDGLSDKTASERLKKYGANELSAEVSRWWQILWRQLRSPFLYLLAGAGLLALFLGEAIDAGFIFLFILINTSLGFYQEYRSDRSLKLLKKYIASRDTVRRDGKLIEIATREIAPGDIVIIKTGDVVPADIRLLKADGLIVDESILTGESAAVFKKVEALKNETGEYHRAANVIFSGTTIVGGSAEGVVVTTGNATGIGAIAKLTKETVKESEFYKGISRFSKFILRLVGLTLIAVFIANLVIKRTTDIGDLLIFSIALAVAVIPEALPLVSIFSLSRGALRLAKKKVVVKRLTAIEDLGNINLLCTDKTGTLTENILTVAETKAVKDNTSLLMLYANLAAQALDDPRADDPFDRALLNALNRQDRQILKKYRRLKEMPFDPQKRFNSVLVEKDGELELIIRGAPEAVATAAGKTHQNWIKGQGEEGHRVLAIATKRLVGIPADWQTEINGCSLIGFISFEDPIKKTSFAAIKQAKELGVEIKILTGDSPEVAGAVASEIGLIANPQQVITAAELTRQPPAKQRKLAEKFSVFARVSPEEKYRIISLLQEKYRVGFLGEGINDAPALKASSVSLVVQSAADVAREAADIILLQKSLHVIIEGIKEGRQIFSNTFKYIRATLASNFGNFYAVAISSLFIDFLPMLPVQILLVNLLSDFPMIAIAVDKVDADEIKQPHQYQFRDIALIATFLGIVSTIFDFIFFALYFRISPAVLQTNWFIASILTELVFLFSIRTKRLALKSRPAGIVIALTAIAFMTTLILPYTAFGQAVFHFKPPTLNHLLTMLSLVVLYFATSETVKLLYYRFFPSKTC